MIFVIDTNAIQKNLIVQYTNIVMIFVIKTNTIKKNERPAPTNFLQPEVLHARPSHLLNRRPSSKQARKRPLSSEQAYQKLTSRAQRQSTGTPARHICSNVVPGPSKNVKN